MIFGDHRGVTNEQIKQIALLVALDLADITDDVNAAVEEPDPKIRREQGHEANDFLRSAKIYRESLTRLAGVASLNPTEQREVTRLLGEVDRLTETAKRLKSLTA